MTLRLVLASAVLLLPAVPSADVVPLTDPVVIGQPPDPDYALDSPEVAALPGGFVVAWSASFARYRDGERYDWGGGLAGRKVRADGVPQGGEMPLVPVAHSTFRKAPRVAANAAGSFVVTWAETTLDDPGPISQNLRRFPAGGVAGPRRVLDRFVDRPYDNPSAVALDAAGRAFAVWTRPRSPAQTGLLAQLFLPAGAPLGERFWASLRPGSQPRPDLALDGLGRAVLAYESLGPGGNSGVFLRRFDPAGRPLGGEALAASPAVSAHPSSPALAVHRDGRIVVAWADDNSIWARRFDPPLQRVGAPIRVHPGAPFPDGNPAGSPDVAMDAQGRFLVVWLTLDSLGHDPEIWGRAYAADGTPLGPELLISRPESEVDLLSISKPSVAAGDGATFLVTWAERDSDEVSSVFARLYAVR